MTADLPTPIVPRDPHLQAVTDALSAPFDPTEVKFKPQMVKNNRALAMAYIDARVIQDRLDDVMGVENWQDEYEFLPDDSVVCRLRLHLSGQWVTKMDVGSPSEQPDAGDRRKAAVSDALKRAAVKFGLGRYLYRLSAAWVDYDPVKKQFVHPPQLPAFALPKPVKQAAKAVEPPKPAKPVAAKPTPAAVPAPAPVEVVPPTPVAGPGSGTSLKPGLPSNGAELHRRLREYDAKLAAQKLCILGALLAHVTQAGVKAGFTANLADWAGPAIPFAVDAVKAFEQSVKSRPAEPRNAA